MLAVSWSDFEALVSQLSRPELEAAFEVLQRRARRIDAAEAAQWAIGTLVEFATASGVVTGRVEKTCSRTVKVRTADNRTWRVSPHLLRRRA